MLFQWTLEMQSKVNRCLHPTTCNHILTSPLIYKPMSWQFPMEFKTWKSLAIIWFLNYWLQKRFWSGESRMLLRLSVVTIKDDSNDWCDGFKLSFAITLSFFFNYYSILDSANGLRSCRRSTLKGLELKLTQPITHFFYWMLLIHRSLLMNLWVIRV